MADFGLARGQGGEGPPEGTAGQPKVVASPNQLLQSPLTLAGTILGTPAYMSPEQHRGEAADSRSDQFSFCAALYEALYHTMPFAGDTLAALSFNVLAGRVRPVPHGNRLPRKLEHSLQRGLSVAAEQRFPSMEELISALTIDPQRDPAGDPLARRLFIATLLGSVTITTTSLLLTRSRGQAYLYQLLAVAIFLFLGSLGAAILLRRSLLGNAFHRSLVRMVIILFGQMALMRILGLMLGLSLGQMVAIDILAMGGISATIVAQLLPKAWFLPVGCVIAAGIQAAFPNQQYSEFIYPVMAIGFALMWSQAAGEQARCRATQVAGAVRSRISELVHASTNDAANQKPSATYP